MLATAVITPTSIPTPAGSEILRERRSIAKMTQSIIENEPRRKIINRSKMRIRVRYRPARRLLPAVARGGDTPSAVARARGRAPA